MHLNKKTTIGTKINSYSKLIISCAIVTACAASSASAMLSHAFPESYMRSARLLTVFAHHFRPKNHPQQIILRNYYVEKELNKEEKQRIVIKTLTARMTRHQMDEILTELATRRVDSNTINLVNELYDENNRLQNTAPIIHQESTYPISTTGC